MKMFIDLVVVRKSCESNVGVTMFIDILKNELIRYTRRHFSKKNNSNKSKKRLNSILILRFSISIILIRLSLAQRLPHFQT